MKKPSSFWYSKIQSYNQCPRKFKLQYVDEEPLVVPKTAAMEFGTAMHLGIQAALEGEDPIMTFGIYWDAVKGDNLEYEGFSWERHRETGSLLLDRFMARHLKLLKPIVVEARQYGTIGNHEFEGTPDFYGDYKGVRSIVDFKTAMYPYIKEKAAIADQLMGYAHLLQQNEYPLPKQIVYIVFVKREPRIQTITFPLTKPLLSQIIGNMNSQINRILSDKEYPMNLNACPMYKSACVCASKLYADFKCKKED